MDKQTARNLALSHVHSSLKREKIEPDEFLPQFAKRTDAQNNIIDERLEIRELTGDESLQFESDAKQSTRIAMGNMLVKVILLPDSDETLFNKGDREAVLGFGTSKLLPLQNKVLKLSNLTPPTVQAEKRMQVLEGTLQSVLKMLLEGMDNPSVIEKAIDTIKAIPPLAPPITAVEAAKNA
jgi:hypothetical protein